MTLYEYLKMSEYDYDTYDTDYDAVVTVCYIDEEEDEYDKFCNGIIKNVNCLLPFSASLFKFKFVIFHKKSLR